MGTYHRYLGVPIPILHLTLSSLTEVGVGQLAIPSTFTGSILSSSYNHSQEVYFCSVEFAFVWFEI